MPTTPLTHVRRDPTWIRERLFVLLTALAPPATKKKEPRAEWPDRLLAPISAEEEALCDQVAELAQLVGLAQVESDLLLLTTAASWVPPVDGLLVHVEAATRSLLFRALGIAVQAPSRAVREALSEAGLLYVLADIEVGGERPVRLELDPDLATLQDLGEPGTTAAEIVRGVVPHAPAPTLPLSAHAHLEDAVPAALQLLVGAMQERAAGVHVLLHGAPGLGKSELARGLALAAGATALEVPSTWCHGRPRPATMRLDAWHLAQHVHGGSQRTLLIFDEAEDAIASLEDRGDTVHRNQVAKGYFTRRLEQAQVPTVWIANDISGLDPAYLRRFTLVVHVVPPPQAMRKALASTLLAPAGVGAGTVDAVTRHASATPALVAQAARALSLMGTDPALPVDRAAVALLRGHLGDVTLEDPLALTAYDPDIVELEGGLDAATLAERLHSVGQGRVLLHGPPGTGKSAFARYVADRSGRPLHSHDAATLLSKWVGDTEKQLAGAFRDAARSKAVLVLDEADALLFRRDASSASWEGSQVAQALLEVERYPGVLVATSNLLPRIDEAFHRRFDLVLEVRAPGATRRALLVANVATSLGLQPPPPAAIAGLQGLVPGHLRQLQRRWALIGPPTTTEALVAALQLVVRGFGNRTPMGFSPVRAAAQGLHVTPSTGSDEP